MSKHRRIKEIILNKIKDDTYNPSDRLPTEKELCEAFEVSRTTVRIALKQLEKEGYLYRVQGRGTFVAEKKVTQALTQTVKQYSDQVAVQGKTGEIKVISLQVVPADDILCKHLPVSKNAPIQKIERIRQANSNITQYEASYIPWETAPAITQGDAEDSLYRTLKEKYHQPITRTVEKIEIIFADDSIAKLLNYEVNHPCFYIETTTYGQNEKAIEYSNSYFRGDITDFVIERNYIKKGDA